MNQVVIKHTYLNSKATISINGEEISQYSELSALLNRSFHEWVGKLLEELDAEIYDDYVIDYFALPFQYELLKAQSSEYCREIRYYPIDTLYEPTTMAQSLIAMCQRHNMQVECKNSARVYSECALELPKELVKSDALAADLCVFGDFEKELKAINAVISNSTDVRVTTSSGKIVFHLPVDMLASFLDFYKIVYVNTPAIENCINALKYTQLTIAEKTELESIQTGKASFYLGPVPDNMDADNECKIEFISFPTKKYTLISVAPDIVSYNNGTLKAIRSGSATLVVRDESNVTVGSRIIQVIEHQYVQEIRFVPDFEYMKRNERKKLGIVLLPAGAEDQNDLEWSVSPFSAAQVTNNGEITALETGTAYITVKSRKAQATYELHIRPDLQGLRFDPQKVQLIKGETKVITCLTTPPDAAVDKLAWSFDNANIASCNPSLDGRKCQMIASGQYTGSGNLRCYDPATGIGAICNIEVVQNNADNFLALIALILIIAGLFFPPLELGAIAAAGYGLYSNRGKEKLGRYWWRLIVSVLLFLILMSV